MAKAASKKKLSFWQSREGYIAEIVVALLLAYGLVSRAIDTGSLIQYFVTLVLIGFAINRVVKIFHR